MKLSGSLPDDGIAAEILIVDVGGGRGQILDELRKAMPRLKGRMVVQD